MNNNLTPEGATNGLIAAVAGAIGLVFTVCLMPIVLLVALLGKR